MARPRTGRQTSAEYQRRYRERKKAQGAMAQTNWMLDVRLTDAIRHEAKARGLRESEFATDILGDWYEARFGGRLPPAQPEAPPDTSAPPPQPASINATVLIQGESGTGKELVARASHYESDRSAAHFVPVNCAAIPEALVESELFGFVKGAFTGATTTRAGFFQTADGGTIFLDEISEMNPSVQAKLLRVLQDQEVRMVGSDKTRRTDVRIVAATNKELPALVRAGEFRADLYFRLHVLPIEIPPLRDREGDVRRLLEFFAGRVSRKVRAEPLSFSERALRALERYEWPGNVRELENLVQRLAVMVDDSFIDITDLPEHMRTASKTGSKSTPDTELRSLQDVEQAHIARVLDSVDGNRTRAAEILGIDRTTLRRKLKNLES